jgi:transposase-like protein
MAKNSVDETIEHHLFERPLPYCPSCGSTKLVPVSRDGNVDYLCRRCSSCWHVELGAFWRVAGPPALESHGAVARGERS